MVLRIDVDCRPYEFESRMAAAYAKWEGFPRDARNVVRGDMRWIVRHEIYPGVGNHLTRLVLNLGVHLSPFPCGALTNYCHERRSDPTWGGVQRRLVPLVPGRQFRQHQRNGEFNVFLFTGVVEHTAQSRGRRRNAALRIASARCDERFHRPDLRV
jgi:hypothetical protein